MSRFKVLSVIVLVALAFAAHSIAQEGRPDRGDRRGDRGDRQRTRAPRDNEQMQQRMAQYRQRAAERMKEALGSTDEEWTVLQPMVEKVQTLAMQARAGAMMGSVRRMGARNVPGARTPSDLEIKSQQLSEVLRKENASPDEIRNALKAFRDAREKANKELIQAQNKLRELLTIRQEAQLVTMGLLD